MITTSATLLPVAVPSQSSGRPPVDGYGAAPARLRVEDVMRTPTSTVGPTTPVSAAAALLVSGGCAGVPVVSSTDEVIGVVTEADLVRNQLGGRLGRRPAGNRGTVAEVMTSTPLLAPRDHDLAALAGLMLAGGTSTVPVVDGGRLVGVVDLRDMLRAIGSAQPA